MEAYNAIFPWIVLTLALISSVCLVIGGAYTAFQWAAGPSDLNNTKAGNLYAGIWVFVGSCLAAMACLWIAKQILLH